MILVAAFALHAQYPLYRHIGRFLLEEGVGMSCEWPGSAIQFRTKGKTASVRMKASTTNDRWQVDIDGKPTQILKLDPNQENYSIDLPSDSPHLVTLVRRTECFAGATNVRGVSAGQADPPPYPERQIEIVGDSISAGYGVDGKTKEEHFSPDTSNAYMTYGWIAARQLKADCTIVAWSGRKMWPDNTVPEIYDYALPNEKKGQSEQLDNPNMDAVLVNLATNDFGQGIPDKFKWCNSYAAFVKKLRTRFPKAHIYLATGSMMTDSWPPEKKHLSTLKGYLDSILKQLNDPKVHRIDFDPQLESDGIGADWHPNQVTQTKMGNTFAAALKKDLGW